ncbi:MAG: RDD family protein [Nitrospinota bacterium]|nr:RDD family protein [Nitrospinota bacterium]
MAELSLEGEGGEGPDTPSLDDDEEFGELPSEGEDIVGQDELDALLDDAGGEVEINEEGGFEDSDEVDEEDFEPASAADPFGDEGEIDAFVDDDAEEVPAPVAVEEPAEEEAPIEHREEMEASVQNRLIAGVVDTVLIGTLEGAFAIGTHFIVRQVVDSIYSNMEALALVLTLDLVTLFLLSFFYAVYFIGGWGGAPGQRVAGLVVVDLGEQPVGYMQAVLRYFGTLAAILPAGLGQIRTIIDKKGRGLGDRLAGTKGIFRASL